MTILDRVLTELRSAKGPVRSADLAARVGVSEATLSGMISVLVAKGELARNDSEPLEDVVACSGLACGTSCVGLGDCPFIAAVPRTTVLVTTGAGSR